MTTDAGQAARQIVYALCIQSRKLGATSPCDPLQLRPIPSSPAQAFGPVTGSPTAPSPSPSSDAPLLDDPLVIKEREEKGG
jgi:hypothetical protein